MIDTIPVAIYKGLPSEHAQAFLNGEILFRSFSYFMRAEDSARNDGLDGRHVDAPDHDVTIENLSTGKIIKGAFECHNVCGKPDRLFCFCTSTSREACAKFGNACIEISDVQDFKSWLERALQRLNRLTALDTPLLLANRVTYYLPNEPLPSTVDVKNTHHLAFVKRSQYSSENEFRFVFSRRGGRALVQKLVTKAYRPIDDLKDAPDKECFLKIGSVRDIARIV